MSPRAEALRAAVVLVLGGSAALGAVPAAHAGTYVINNCPAAPAPNGDPGPWVIFGSPQAPKASCGGGSGDWVGPRGASMSPGTNTGVAVAVPPGSAIAIREAKLWWYVPQQSSGATTFAIAASDRGTLGESATPLERRGAPDVFVLPSSTTSLTLDDYCSNDDAGQGCNFGGGLTADLLLFGSQLTLEDSRLPTGSVTGGGLTAAGALSGDQSIAYRAEDGDSGVRSVALVIDGQLAAQRDYGAQCPYTNFMACPPVQSGSIDWNTASVPDGQHSVELVVANAAQDSNVVYDETVTTDNATPAPLNGARAGTGSAPLSAVVGAGPGARLSLFERPVVTRTFRSSALRLTGRLLDSAGAPVSGATLDILQQGTGTVGPMRLIAHAQTRADGTFATNVVAGPSRTIEVGYRGSVDDSEYTTRAIVRESVGAGVQLRVSPTHTAPDGTIRLTGRVSGPVPAQGVLVGLLVHYRGQWEPFRTPRTDSHGRFSVAYQFQGGVGRFPFRARVFGGQAGFPYAHGESGTVTVSTG
jgi:hypothetical protein